MPYYICYFVNDKNATVDTTHGIHENDQAAIAWADGLLRQNVDCFGVELWREAKCLYRTRRSDA